MEQDKSKYKKFSAKNNKFVDNDRLWMGQDHLLLVESTGISERYKRFYYKDIQAINIVKTSTALFKTIALSALLLLTGFLCKVTWDSRVNEAAIIFPVAACLIFLFYLIRIFIKGSSCKCWIYSSVQKEKITPVNTMKTAKKFLDIIVPEIEKIQGILPFEAFASAKERLTAKPGGILINAVPTPKKIISLVWHRTLFLLMMAFGILLLVFIKIHPPAMVVTIGLLVLVTMAIATIAVARQTGSTLSSKTKTISIASLVTIILSIAAGYVEYMFFLITNMEEWVTVSHNQWEIVKLLAQVDPFKYPIILGKDIFIILILFFLGLAGLINIWMLDR